MCILDAFFKKKDKLWKQNRPKSENWPVLKQTNNGFTCIAVNG